jgi:3-hydroxy-9,10-secoandrosta-1,3,5(10)-triene-9,17-dione monooxygenase
MGQLVETELMERARQLVPVLRERSVCTDTERRVPPESIAELRAAGLLDALLPRALGGSEVDFSVFSSITRLLATGCGSTAWVYAILTETAWIAALFPQKAQEEAWEDRSALFCASVVPYGKARKVDGGYRISGRWQYLSGSDYATWVVLHASTETEGSIGTLVRRSDLCMIDDWQVLGLAGTGSKAGAADDVFVPAWRTLPWSGLLAGTAPGRAVHPTYLLGKVPRNFVTPFSLNPVIVGLATRALELATEMMRKQASGPALPDWPAMQSKFADATLDVELANLILSTYAQRNDEVLRSGLPITERDIAITRMRGSRAAAMAKQAIDKIVAISGSKFIYDANPLQVILRDALAAASHRSSSWELAALGYCATLSAARD